MDGPKILSKLGISITATVLEIAELRHFSLGDGIFLRSFVLCGFGIVSKSEVPEGQLETKFAPGSNPGWMPYVMFDGKNPGASALTVMP
jgi:hypothetical protein